MTNYNDGKWYGWNGGECPVHPETVVHWVNTEGDSHKTLAGTLCWNDELAPVAAFRVIKEHREPREFWVKVVGENITFGGTIYAQCDADHPRAIRVREVIE